MGSLGGARTPGGGGCDCPPPPEFMLPPPPRPPHLQPPGACANGGQHDACDALPLIDASYRSNPSLQTSAVIGLCSVLVGLLVFIAVILVWKHKRKSQSMLPAGKGLGGGTGVPPPQQPPPPPPPAVIYEEPDQFRRPGGATAAYFATPVGTGGYFTARSHRGLPRRPVDPGPIEMLSVDAAARRPLFLYPADQPLYEELGGGRDDEDDEDAATARLHARLRRSCSSDEDAAYGDDDCFAEDELSAGGGEPPPPYTRSATTLDRGCHLCRPGYCTGGSTVPSVAALLPPAAPPAAGLHAALARHLAAFRPPTCPPAPPSSDSALGSDCSGSAGYARALPTSATLGPQRRRRHRRTRRPYMDYADYTDCARA